MSDQPTVPRPKLALAVLSTGLAAGLGGAAMSWAMHTAQTLGFGHEVPHFGDPYSAAEPWRRVVVLAAVGLLATILWWALRRPAAAPMQSVTAMVAGDTETRRRPPLWRGLANAVVQVVAVGAGASVGREVAPREVGALLAGRLGDAFGLNAGQRRVLVASGAAAGLAAVYHVPLGGALFALEVLLGAFSLPAATTALATSALATVVARLTVSPEPFYRVHAVPAGLPMLLGAAAVGLLLAVPALWFRRGVAWAEAHRLAGTRMLVGLPLTFLLTGLVAAALPGVLGNGLVAAQSAFGGGALGPALLLLAAKVLLVLLTLGAGAVGGTLTPAFAVGALAGTACADLLGPLVPGADLAPLAVVAAAAFLAVSMNAPLTAVMLTIGFTEQPPAAFLPIVVAVAAASGVARWRQAAASSS